MTLSSIALNQHQHIPNLVVGAGLTGLSCLRYLDAKGESAKFYDDTFSQEKVQKVKEISDATPLFDKDFDLEEVLAGVKTLFVSPGISFKHPLLDRALQKELELIGDIELFARQNKQAVIAVTGSNAKSTVVTLLYLMAKEEGLKVSLAGNIGRPLLDSILEDEAELYVLELSSFQLDITKSLEADVASILNISPDHLDRYDSFEHYASSKQGIYSQAKNIVFNRDDVLTQAEQVGEAGLASFGLDQASEGHFGLKDGGEGLSLCYGDQKVIAANDCAKKAQTDIQNALAAMAIAHTFGISFKSIVQVLKTFKGLEHRCEWVAEFNGVVWINDSKGTNVGATQAALESLDTQVVLIAGGDSKDGDLSLLDEVVSQKVKQLILIGVDAPLFKARYTNQVDCVLAANLEEAVDIAATNAIDGDTVLLSPACSSLDMFKNYQERGDHFKDLVQKKVGSYGG